jgi:hypothetical protein
METLSSFARARVLWLFRGNHIEYTTLQDAASTSLIYSLTLLFASPSSLTVSLDRLALHLYIGRNNRNPLLDAHVGSGDVSLTCCYHITFASLAFSLDNSTHPGTNMLRCSASLLSNVALTRLRMI